MKNPVIVSSSRFPASIALAVAGALTFGSSVQATSLYWDINGAAANTGTASTGAWNGTNLFWNNSSSGTGGTTQAVTAATDDLFFSSGTNFSAASAVTISGGVFANSLTFQQAGAVTLSGTGITIGNGAGSGINFSNGAGVNVISAPITLAANSAFTNSDNSLQTVSGGVTGAFNLAINGDSTGGMTLSTGSVNNGGTITNSGSGTNTTTISGIIGTNVTGVVQNSANSALIISGANASYAGTTTITTGTLTASGAANNTFTALGTGGIALDGGTLNLKSNGAANGGSTIITGNGATGNNVTMGSTAATISVNNNGSNSGNSINLNNLSIGTGQLNVSGGNQYTLRFAGTTALTGNATINATSSSLSLVGIVSDGGGNFGITKLGATSSFASTPTGVLTVSAANTYTGVTSVLEGVLVLNGAAPSGSAGTLGNATSAVLLGNTTGSVNAYLMANNYAIARDVTVQSGGTGLAYLGSSSTSGSGSYTGNITLGTAGGTGRNLTLVSGAFHQLTFGGVIQDPTGLSGTAGVVTIGDTSTANFLTGTFAPNPTNGSTVYLMAGASTYTGGTVIDTSGAVRINSADAFGTGNLSLVRGVIQGNGTSVLAGISGMTWDGNFSVNSFTTGGQGAVNLGTAPITLTGNRVIGVSNNTTTIGGAISGSGRSLQLNGGNSATQALVLNGASTFDGGLTVAGATNFDLTATSGNATALGTGQLNVTNSVRSKVSLNVDTTVGSLTSGINNSATVTTGGTSTLAAGTYALTITGGGGTGATGTATISALNGPVTAVSITGLGKDYTSAPTITLSSSTATFTPAAFGSSSIALGNKTLTLAGTNASPATYAGVISGTGGRLVKNGTGTQALNGINTYSGATTINGGTLALGASGSISNTSGVSLGTGGTFDVSAKGGSGYTVNNLTGSGDVIGSLTVSTQLAIGNSPGTTTFDSLTLGAASTYVYELTGGISPGDGSSDLGIVDGNLTFFSGATLDLVQLGSYTAGNKFTLFAYTGTLDGIFKDTGAVDLADGATFTDALGLWTIDYNDTSAGLNGGTTSGASYVTITAVPEPRAALLGGLGLLALLRRRRLV